MPNIEPEKNISTLYDNIKTIIDTSKKEAKIQLKDPPYFLDLQDSFSERDLESTIWVAEVNKFDMVAVKEWSEFEAISDKFEVFRDRVESLKGK